MPPHTFPREKAEVPHTSLRGIESMRCERMPERQGRGLTRFLSSPTRAYAGHLGNIHAHLHRAGAGDITRSGTERGPRHRGHRERVRPGGEAGAAALSDDKGRGRRRGVRAKPEGHKTNEPAKREKKSERTPERRVSEARGARDEKTQRRGERFPPPPMMRGCMSTPAWPPSAPTLLAQRVRARTHGPLKASGP